MSLLFFSFEFAIAEPKYCNAHIECDMFNHRNATMKIVRSSLYWNLISDFSCIQKSVLLFYPLSNWRWVNQTLGLRIHYIARASIINVWTHFCLHYLIIIFHHNLRMEFWNMYEWSCSVRSEKGRNRRGNRRKLCKLVNIDVDKFDTSY